MLAPACMFRARCTRIHLHLGTAVLASMDVKRLADAILRYHYYVEVGIDSRHVAPFREEWAGNALALLPPLAPAGVSQEYYDALIRSSLEEMHAEYVTAMKKSMVKYVTASAVERRRLNLTELEPLLDIPSPLEQSWRSVVDRTLPQSWRANVDTAREEVAWTLQTLSANALELSKLWHASRFSTSLLVDVGSPDFHARLPMTADSFKDFEAEVQELLKSQLWTSWAPKSIEIFSRLPPVFINGDADAYFRAAATLQSNQLRDLVTRSLDAYVKFFSQHTPVTEIDPQQDTLHWSVPPVFQLDLIDDAGKPSFKPTFQECEDVVRNIMDNVVLACGGLPRVGTNTIGSTSFAQPGSLGVGSGAGPGALMLGGAAGAGGYSSSSIPSTTLQEENVINAKKVSSNNK